KPVGNVPTSPNKDIGKEPTLSEQLHKGLSRFGDTPSEQIARSYEDIKNKARKKGIRLRGRTQNYSNDAFATPISQQSKFDNGINRYNSRGQQEINDYRSKQQDIFVHKQLYVWLLLLGILVIFLLRISFRKEIKKEPSVNIPDDRNISDINLLNNDIPRPLYSNYKGEALEKQLIKKYS